MGMGTDCYYGNQLLGMYDENSSWWISSWYLGRLLLELAEYVGFFGIYDGKCKLLGCQVEDKPLAEETTARRGWADGGARLRCRRKWQV